MSNPFLFDDDDGGDVAADAASNPFLQDAPAETEDFAADSAADNPFFGAQAINPFANYETNDDSEQQPAIAVHPKSTVETIIAAESTSTTTQPTTASANPVDSAMSFFGTTITDTDEEEHDTHSFAATSNFYDETEQNEQKIGGPPPRPNPPNQATQDLISTLTDHLDQTSSHLLGRLPATRTPSPVSMRDLHSPSPTPECADLLDVTDNFGDLEASGDVAPENVSQSDNPFADMVNDNSASIEAQPIFKQQSYAPAVPPQPQVASQKTAPLPARPPRPTPPRRPSPPSQVIPQQIEKPSTTSAQKVQDTEADLFDMFGTNALPKQHVNVPKSNQDILNLFAAPAKPTVEPQQQDLLMSDIFSMSNEESVPVNLPPVVADVKPPVPPPPRKPAPIPVVAQIAHEETMVIENNVTHLTSQPEAPHTQILSAPVESEAVAISSIQINDEPINYIPDAITSNDFEKSDTLSDNSSAIESSIRTPEVSTPFYTGAAGDYLDRGQTPVSRDEIVNSYINDQSYVSPSATAANPFGTPDTAVAPIRPTMASYRKNDAFDAFAAKFDSVKKEENSLIDGFGGSGSGYKSPLPPADGNFCYIHDL